MKKIIKDNLKKITALLLVVSMATSFDLTVFAWDADANASETDVENISSLTEEDNFAVEGINGAGSDTLDGMTDDEKKAEEAREKECMWGDKFSEKLLTYLCLKYQDIGKGIDINDVSKNKDKIATQMAKQVSYNTIEIDGDDTFDDRGYQNLTDNMVQFKLLGQFGESIYDENNERVYPDTVKTLIIKNVDEIRNLYVPASVETLIIENTTFNCYRYYKDSPGIQSGMYPGDLKYCENLKKLVLKNVKFGDNYKRGEAANLLPEITHDCPYETDYRLNLQNCHNLEELEIDVNFDGAEEVQLAIDGGYDNQFSKLTDDKCKISPAPGTGSGQLTLICNPNSYLAKRYKSSAAVEFKNPNLSTWLLEAGYDTNHDGVISQVEMDSIETLTINNQTVRSVVQYGLNDFMELADIEKMHGLKTLELDYYDPSDSSDNPGHSLKGIDFPQSLENLSMKNIYWSKGSDTKTHDNVNIILNNLKTLELYNTNVDSGTFDDLPEIVLTDTKGALQSCIIEKTDVKSIKLINNSEEKGVDKENDEKQRIRFSAPECKKLECVEFLGEGYAVEGSLDLTNDTELTHIGVPNGDKSQWTIYGEFDSTYAPINVTLNGCSKLGSNYKETVKTGDVSNEIDIECNNIVIDYDFINGRDINVHTLGTNFNKDHALTIFRKPRILNDKAGNVYLLCDKEGWIYNNYKEKEEDGFVIEDRSSFPTIAVFANGQQIRSDNEDNCGADITEDSKHWVNRWDLVMPQGGYCSSFGNCTFYVVDKESDGSIVGLRKVFYNEPVYVSWEQQDSIEPFNRIIDLPTKKEGDDYKLIGSKLSSTGKPGEVELKLYVYEKNGDGSFKTDENGNKIKSYIGFQNIKVYKMPDSVELVNDGTEFGSGTKEDPFIIYKDEELKLKARPLVKNGDSLEVDRSGDYALRDIYWRIKEYDETHKITSDSDGYSLYTLDSATEAGISVVRENLNPGETEEQYDRRRDTVGVDGQAPTYYNHRRFKFDTSGSKFKIVAQVPYKNNDVVITKEIFVECNKNSKPVAEEPAQQEPAAEDPSDAPVYVDPVKDPDNPTPGVSFTDKKKSGEYVMPDPAKNEVVYKAPPAGATKKTVSIPDKITVDGKKMLVVKVDPEAFKNNNVVKKISVGKYVKVIGNGAFEGATNLSSVTLGKNVEIIGNGAFKGCTKLTSVTIPGKTTRIGDRVFEGDVKLKKVTIGKNVELIGNGAFKDCIRLTSITIPSKTTKIGDRAFEGDVKLKSVTIGKNVALIGDGVFEGCTILKSIKITTKKLTSDSIAGSTFNGLSERTTIRVPKSMLLTYKELFTEKGINPDVKIKKY